MVMGENEEVGCLWFVECELWLVVCGVWFVVCGLWFVAYLFIYLFIYLLFIYFVVCDVWFVVCGLWCVLSNPGPPIESAQLGVCALGEPSYTVELSHVLPAVPLSQVVGHPSIHPSNLSWLVELSC